jgi:hypothetical protein
MNVRIGLLKIKCYHFYSGNQRHWNSVIFNSIEHTPSASWETSCFFLWGILKVHYHGHRSIYPEQNEFNSHLSVHFLSYQTFCFLPFDEVLVPSPTPKLENHSLLFACDLFFSVYTPIHYMWRLYLLSPAERCTVPWWRDWWNMVRAGNLMKTMWVTSLEGFGRFIMVC